MKDLDPAFKKFLSEFEAEAVKNMITTSASTVPHEYSNDQTYVSGHYNGYLKGFQEAMEYVQAIFKKNGLQ
jgi:hypothetical protein